MLFERTFLNHKLCIIGLSSLLTLHISIALFQQVIKLKSIPTEIFYTFFCDVKHCLLLPFFVRRETLFYQSVVRHKVTHLLAKMVVSTPFEDHNVNACRLQPLAKGRNQFGGLCPISLASLNQRL